MIDALSSQYSTFRAFNKAEVLTALLTAEANGLLEESRFDLDDDGELRLFFRAHAEGVETINRYSPVYGLAQESRSFFMK